MKKLTMIGMAKASKNFESYLLCRKQSRGERSTNVPSLVKEVNACCEEILCEKQSYTHQKNLDSFFKPTSLKHVNEANQ